uniref:ATP synthase subunit OSCP n=1 Tax=Artemia franciscana TaxID=6661 RepID=UPI003B642B80
MNDVSQAARQFSTTSAATQLVKAPIQVFGIEGRYATALYSAAVKQKKLEAVEKDLVQLNASLKKFPRLGELLKNPTLSRQLKKDAIGSMLKEQKAVDLTSNFLDLLTENNRLKMVDGVINAFKTIMAAHRGEVICEVTSAKPLDEAARKDLEVALKGFLKPGQNIKLTLKTDPAIIGGLVVSIGDRFVDMSIGTKIKRYTAALKTAV